MGTYPSSCRMNIPLFEFVSFKQRVIRGCMAYMLNLALSGAIFVTNSFRHVRPDTTSGGSCCQERTSPWCLCTSMFSSNLLIIQTILSLFFWAWFTVVYFWCRQIRFFYWPAAAKATQVTHGNFSSAPLAKPYFLEWGPLVCIGRSNEDTPTDMACTEENCLKALGVDTTAGAAYVAFLPFCPAPIFLVAARMVASAKGCLVLYATSQTETTK